MNLFDVRISFFDRCFSMDIKIEGFFRKDNLKVSE